MSRVEAGDEVGEARAAPDAQDPSTPPGGVAGERLILLMKEFRRRQRSRPEMVVRPWWAPRGSADGAGAPNGAGTGAPPSPYRPLGAVGFIVEYCPRGVESAELAVRRDRVRVEGPGGVVEGRLDLEAGWTLDGRDRVCPETLANYLLRMADEVLG